MAFHTFRHPEFAGPYRNYRLITENEVQPPKAGWVPAGQFPTEEDLRWFFRISADDWTYAMSRMEELGYFAYAGGVLSDLPAA